MTEDEWIEYYEAINGKKPTKATITRARNAGKFNSEAGEENVVDESASADEELIEYYKAINGKKPTKAQLKKLKEEMQSREEKKAKTSSSDSKKNKKGSNLTISLPKNSLFLMLIGATFVLVIFFIALLFSGNKVEKHGEHFGETEIIKTNSK